MARTLRWHQEWFRESQYEEYKDKIGEIAIGIVKRIEFGNLIVDLGKSEAIIKREELIPRETFKNGDRVRAYIYEVKNDLKGYQVFLSRTHPQFVAKLFTQEVPEIYEGVIKVKSVARDPGSRAKISIYTEDSTIDPVGACVGMRGSRIQAIVRELSNEKIDIINHSEQPEILISRALSPAKPLDLYIDDERKYCVALFQDDELEFAIGRGGVNINLASRVTDFKIDAFGKKQYERQQQDQATSLSEIPDFDESLVTPLLEAGFNVVSELLNADEESLLEIDAMDDEKLEQCYLVVQSFIERVEEEVESEEDELNLDEIMDEVNTATEAEVEAMKEDSEVSEENDSSETTSNEEETDTDKELIDQDSDDENIEETVEDEVVENDEDPDDKEDANEEKAKEVEEA